MILDQAPAEPGPLRRRLRALYRADETKVVEALLAAAELPPEMLDRIAARARQLVHKVRQNRVGGVGSTPSCMNTSFPAGRAWC